MVLWGPPTLGHIYIYSFKDIKERPPVAPLPDLIRNPFGLKFDLVGLKVDAPAMFPAGDDDFPKAKSTNIYEHPITFSSYS